MLSNTGEAVGSPNTQGEVLFTRTLLVLVKYIIRPLYIGRLHAIRTITVVCALLVLHVRIARTLTCYIRT